MPNQTMVMATAAKIAKLIRARRLLPVFSRPMRAVLVISGRSLPSSFDPPEGGQRLVRPADGCAGAVLPRRDREQPVRAVPRIRLFRVELASQCLEARELALRLFPRLERQR